MSQDTLKEVMCRGALSVTGHRRVPPEPLYSCVLLGPLLGGKGKVPMTKVIERVEAHYEVQGMLGRASNVGQTSFQTVLENHSSSPGRPPGP